jgi:NADH pyrophosphatase NudC (nudix superfamily)
MVVMLMKTTSKKRFCEHCEEETTHKAMEDALEIEYRCQQCGRQQEIYKTFF